MHEYSIVRGIVEIAGTEAKKLGNCTVKSIELEIGALSGVEIEALEFIWDLAVQNSVLEDAQKKIVIISGKAHCLDCEKDFETSSFFDNCPYCGSNATGLVKGRELRVKSITIK